MMLHVWARRRGRIVNRFSRTERYVSMPLVYDPAGIFDLEDWRVVRATLNRHGQAVYWLRWIPPGNRTAGTNWMKWLAL